jgi:hypothetical protein
MQKKGMTYILLAAVAMVWGLVFYRIFSSLGEEETWKPKSSNSFVADTSSEISENFVLSLNYRDPFLSKPSFSVNYSAIEPRSSEVVPKKTPAKAPKVAPAVVQTDWSFLRYIGSVKNQSSGKQVALLNIHGIEKVLGVGESSNDVQVLEHSRDSVFVEYRSEKKWIKR